MPLARRLPNLFGRATAASVDHVRLDAALSQLHDVCAALDPADPSGFIAVRALIAELMRQLSRHFMAEESDGYFGTIASTEPALEERIAELRSDHTLMLEAVERLWLLAERPESSAELGPVASELIRRFRAHERAETALVRRFLSRDSTLDEP